jgi:hypothetical protein
MMGRNRVLRNDRDQNTTEQDRDTITGMGKCSIRKAVHRKVLAPCCCGGPAINGFREVTRNQETCISLSQTIRGRHLAPPTIHTVVSQQMRAITRCAESPHHAYTEVRLYSHPQ